MYPLYIPGQTRAPGTYRSPNGANELIRLLPNGGVEVLDASSMDATKNPVMARAGSMGQPSPAAAASMIDRPGVTQVPIPPAMPQHDFSGNRQNFMPVSRETRTPVVDAVLNRAVPPTQSPQNIVPQTQQPQAAPKRGGIGEFLANVDPSVWSGLMRMGGAMLANNKASRLPNSFGANLGQGLMAFETGAGQALKNQELRDKIRARREMKDALKSAKNPDGTIDQQRLLSIVAQSDPSKLASLLMSKSLADYRNALGVDREVKRFELGKRLSAYRSSLIEGRVGGSREAIARKAAVDAAFRAEKDGNLDDFPGKTTEEKRRNFVEQWLKLYGHKVQ